MLTGTISSRVPMGLSAEDRHASLCKYMSSQKGIWSTRGNPPSVVFGANDVSYFKSLGKFSPDGVQMSVCYNLRHEMLWRRDDASSDDYIKIKLSKKVNVDAFIKEYLDGLLAAFNAYRCEMCSSSLFEWNIANPNDHQSGISNPRRDISRLSLVNYWDGVLCERALRSDPDAIARDMQGKVELVRRVGDGVLLVVSTRLLDVQEEQTACASALSVLHALRPR